MDGGLKLWGVMTASAIVLPNGAPALVKAAARLAKIVFGARIQICDGTDDDVQKQAALDAITQGSVWCSAGNYSDGAKVTVAANKYLVFEDGALVKPDSDIDMFEADQDGGIINLHVDTSDIESYSSDVFQMRGVAWPRNEYNQGRFENFRIDMTDSEGTGVHLICDDGEGIFALVMKGISIRGGNKGLHLETTDTATPASNGWINGNNFPDLRVSRCEYPIYLESIAYSDTAHNSISNNEYYGLQIQVSENTQECIHIAYANENKFIGNFFDWGSAAGTKAISIVGSGDHNWFRIGGITNLISSYFTDEGTGNVVESLKDMEIYGRKWPGIQTGEYEAHTANDTLAWAESGSIHSNLGAGGTIVLSLPGGATAGMRFTFVVMVAQELRINPRDDGAIYIGGSKQTDGKYITANAIGETITLVCVGSEDWVPISIDGTWTVEA